MLKHKLSPESKLCRLCMSAQNLTDIFKFHGVMRLDQKLNYCHLTQVYENDDLPKYICNECENKLTQTYEFKMQCRSVELKLKKLMMVWKGKQIDASSKEEKRKFTNMISYEKNAFNYLDECYRINIIDSEDITINSQDIQKSSKENPFSQILNNKNVISPVANEEQRICLNEDKIMYQCEKCGKTFQSKSVLKRHVVIHSEKVHSCLLCMKKFVRRDYLTVHLKTHGSSKNHQCEECPMKFHNKQDLIRHKKTHSRDRKYSCSHCNKKFKHSFDVTSHMRVHTGQRPFVCKICFKAYKSHSGLKKHRKNHSNSI